MTRERPDLAVERKTAGNVPWIAWGLEGLWILTVVLVPVVFFRPEDLLSETVIAYVEVPKIALLRTLVGLMAVLWLLEWGLKGRLPNLYLLKTHFLDLRPRSWGSSLAGWLRDRPARFVILAAWMYLGALLISTVLSASFRVSFWGEVPGQDGFAAYNIVAYLLLFSVIATHLRTPRQLWRLLGSIALTGTLVSGYAILQHYGHDVFGILEVTGGSGIRATSTVGNAVFAGATMLMPIPITLMLAAISIGKLAPGRADDSGMRRAVILLGVLGLWALVLAIQLLGITFTFTRGAWLATMLSLVGFLGLATIFAGWRLACWAALVLVMAGALAWLALQGPGTMPFWDTGMWVVAVLLLAALVGLGAMLGKRLLERGNGVSMGLYRSETGLAGPRGPRLAKAVVFVSAGMAAPVVTAAVAFLVFTGDGLGRGRDTSDSSTGRSSTQEVQQRLGSITGEVTGELTTGSLHQRGIIWRASWQLMRDVPWFGFDSLALPWLRPIIGYGPDLFRYAYLLESTAADGSYLPLEPDHAHNFFIHQAVEQGILGVLSSLGLFAAMFGAGGYLLLRKRTQSTQVQVLVLSGLLAVMAGRFVEQMVGVARVSDLTIFWALLAVFAVLPAAMQTTAGSETGASPAQGQVRGVRRNRSGRPGGSVSAPYDRQRLVRLALVGWAVGGIIALTWVKTISYPRAGMAAADAVDHFQRGDFQGAVAGLDRAIDLAPDVPVYYNFKSSVLAAYLQYPGAPPEPQCSRRAQGTPYDICLGQKIYLNNLAAVEHRPFYWRSRLALANSALALGRHDEAIRLYRETLELAPASWPLHNRLAEAYIDIGRPQKALAVLEKSLGITGQSPRSDQALRLQEIAFQNLVPCQG